MMAKAKHTPGPWVVRKWSQLMNIQGNIHQVTDGDLYPTAFVPAWDMPGAGEIEGTQEAIANARLIAAAPDLLEALEKIVFDWDGEPEDMIDARAAIAKAKGKDT